MKQSEKMKAMTPEERAAWAKKMAEKRAAKKGEALVVEKPKPAAKPAKKPAPAPAAPASGEDDEEWLW